MPHDNTGKELKVGDLVLIPCKVKSIFINEEYCNVTLDTVYPMFPSTNPTTVTLNSKQVLKDEPCSCDSKE